MLWILFFLVDLSSSSTILGTEILGTGRYCTITNTYSLRVTSAVISPDPPSKDSTIEVAISGIFLDNVWLFALVIDTIKDNVEVSTQFVALNAGYSNGQLATFKFSTPAGTSLGVYKQNFSFNTLYSTPAACWQISYTLI
jgi:hypothetical protein